MLKKSKSQWFVQSIALMVLAMLVLATGTIASDAPSNSDCEDAWKDSSASNSCGELYYQAGAGYVDTSRYHVVAQNNQCYVKVHCRQTAVTHTPTENTFTGSTDDVEDLNNCNGELKIGIC